MFGCNPDRGWKLYELMYNALEIVRLADCQSREYQAASYTGAAFSVLGDHGRT
jgi:hypothetical protein